MRLGIAVSFAAITGLSGCALEHEASARFVDTRLRKNSQPIVAQRAGKSAIRIGSWEVRDVEVTRLKGPGRFGLEPTEGRRRPGHNYVLSLSVHHPSGTHWAANCEGRRAQAVDADYAAVLDQTHEEVAMRCEISSDERIWQVMTGGTLRNNVVGQATSEQRKGTYEIEILTRYKLFTVVRRETPVALGQIRTAAGTVAAMTLARPEHAWLSKGEPDDVGLWIAMLAAHRFMPLGWND